MHSLSQAKQTTLLCLAALALACFGLTPRAQAIVPAPDGCYPNFTTAEGCDALKLLATGAGNTGLGWRSLFFDSTGSFNTGVGGGALALNNGDSNTAVGAAALLLNTAGTENTATGTNALVQNDTGVENTANGAFALSSNTNGVANTACGRNALLNNVSGSLNTALGASAGVGITTASNVICIGANFAASNVSSSCFIANIRDVTTAQNNAIPVFIDGDGQLGTMSSSYRFKTDIKPIDKASESILALKPVSFRYKVHKDTTPNFGLIAEDVAQVNPDLVIYDGDGKPYTVRYEAVNAMLLNEFLKEHKAFLEEHRTVEELKKEVAELSAGLRKVTRQLATASPSGGGLELSRNTPQTVLNDR